jgi:hypothetical protein
MSVPLEQNMVVFFGTRMYGKVDHCPGLFYVATRFFYLQFVPLIPVGSYLVIDGTESERGMSGASIGLSGKSVFFTYLRTALMLGGVSLAIAAVVLGIQAAERQLSWLPALGLGVGAIVCFILFPLTYKISRASPARAVYLAERAGIDLRVVAEHFLERGIQPDASLMAAPEHGSTTAPAQESEGRA